MTKRTLAASTVGTKPPLVSVLTPSYNQAEFLEDCLASVSSQTYKSIEHIVCDGGSQDGTLGILEKSPKHVSWLSEKDKGQSHALNKAFAMSQGQIIGWLNSDDAYFAKDVLERVVDTFDLHPHVDIVYGHSMLVNASGLMLQTIWVPPYSAFLLGRFNYIIQPSAFLRRSAIDGFLVDERYQYVMDKELWLRLSRRGLRFKRLNKILAIDRHQPNRKAFTIPEVAIQETLKLQRDYHLPLWHSYGLKRRAFNILFRFLGLGLLSEARLTHAFNAKCDGYWSLIRRQVSRRRSGMPIR